MAKGNAFPRLAGQLEFPKQHPEIFLERHAILGEYIHSSTWCISTFDTFTSSVFDLKRNHLKRKPDGLPIIIFVRGFLLLHFGGGRSVT